MSPMFPCDTNKSCLTDVKTGVGGNQSENTGDKLILHYYAIPYIPYYTYYTTLPYHTYHSIHTTLPCHTIHTIVYILHYHAIPYIP